MKRISIYFLMIVCLFVTGCGTDKVKEVATLDEFDNVSVNNSFVVNDNMESYKNVDYIVEAKKAVLNDIEIEMIKYTSSDYAKTVHDGQIDSFNLLKNTGAYEEKDKGNNYYRYALVSNGYYMVSTRVDDTLVFCKTLLGNKETVEKIYEDLGY